MGSANSSTPDKISTKQEPTVNQMIVVHRNAVLAFQGQSSAFQWSAPHITRQLLELALSIVSNKPFVHENEISVMPAGGDFYVDTLSIRTQVWVAPASLERKQIQEGTAQFLVKVATLAGISFNPRLLDLSDTTWTNQELSVNMNTEIWDNTVCQYKRASAEVPAKKSVVTARNVGVAAAGLAAALALSYHKLGGKEAVKDVFKKDDQKTYHLARSLQRARYRMESLSSSYNSLEHPITPAQLETLREKISSTYEDLGDFLNIDDAELLDADE